MLARLLLPLLLLADAPRPAEILLLDAGGARLAFVDAVTFEPRGEIRLAGQPRDMAVSPRGDRVLVSDWGDPATRQPGARVFLADLAARTLLNTIDLARPCGPLGIAWAPDESEAWVSCQGRQSVLVLDPATGTVVAEVPLVDLGGNVLVMAPDGARLWVLCQNAARVVELDPRERRVVRRMAVGKSPTDLALAPDGRSLWVTAYGNQEIGILDLATGRVSALLRTPVGPVRVLFSPGRGWAYALGNSSGYVSAYDPERGLELERRAVGTGPMTAAFPPDGSVLAVGLTGRAPGLTLLDPVTLERRAGGALAFAPWGVAFVNLPAAGRVGGGVSPSPQSSK
jgi:streptogramin lyase